MSDEPWREAVEELFEYESGLPDDYETVVVTGLLAFHVTYNSYPEVDVEDIIGWVSDMVCVALRVQNLIEGGQLERYKGPGGKTEYRIVPGSDRIRILK